MSIDLYLTMGILSSWLMFFSSMLFVTLEQDKNFNYIIFDNFQLLRYLSYISVFVIFGYYVFMIRLKGVGTTINIYEFFLNIYEIILLQPWVILCLSGIILMLIILFIFLLTKWLYLNLRRCLLTLYLYCYQYRVFQLLYSNVIDISISSTFYLVIRVRIFTKNTKVSKIAFKFWPGLLYEVEPRIIKVILPYLIIFDIITQDWIISKVFVIMPWYYIYIIIRQIFLGIKQLFTQENIYLALQIYQKIEVDGKIMRWANVMPIPESFLRQDENPKKNKIKT